MKKNRTDKINKIGISLISLIITIIVIIILAAIVIFTGLNTPDRANFAKFVSEFSDFRTAITQDFMNKKAQYAIEGKSRSDEQIYYAIAKSGDYTGDINQAPTPTGKVDTLGINIFPEALIGSDYYEISNDTSVANWKTNKAYYTARGESGERHYLTDKGEPFILPGYLVQQDGVNRWYVNEKKYYISEAPIYGVAGGAAGDSGNSETEEQLADGEVKLICEVVYRDDSALSLNQGIKLAYNSDFHNLRIALKEEPVATLYVSLKIGGVQTFDEWFNQQLNGMSKEEWFVQKDKESYLEYFDDSLTNEEKNAINTITTFIDWMKYYNENGFFDRTYSDEELPSNLEKLSDMYGTSVVGYLNDRGFIDEYSQKMQEVDRDYVIAVDGFSSKHIRFDEKATYEFPSYPGEFLVRVFDYVDPEWKSLDEKIVNINNPNN